MVEIDRYLSDLTELLKDSFGNRLVYAGLQGSYLREEATEDSDIDIMVVIEGLTVADLGTYRALIESLNHADKSCGFICSKSDLANWNPLEIANLLGSTKDYFGELRALVPDYSDQDIRNFVKLSVNNLYHEICHRYIHAAHEKSVADLPGTYKGVFFILQNIYYLTHREFVRTKAELLELLTGKDYEVLKRGMELNTGVPHDFQSSFEILFLWCQQTMKSV